MKNWTVEYLLAVLEKKDWSANRLATESGVAASTINRPLRERDWKYQLKPDTINKIHAASGIDPRPFMPDGLQEATPRFVNAARQPRPLAMNEVRVEISGECATLSAKINRDGIELLREKLDALERLL